MIGRQSLITAAIALVALAGSTATASAAGISPSTTSPRVGPSGGDEVTFTGTTTLVSPTGLTWTWNFGDGTSRTTTTNTATHTYHSTAGPFSVTVSVTDGIVPTPDTGSTSVDPVPDQPPAASLTFSPAAPVVGQSVRFSSTSSDPDGPFSLAWNLDDDGLFNDGSATNVSRSFSTPGPHTVRLKATDDLG